MGCLIYAVWEDDAVPQGSRNQIKVEAALETFGDKVGITYMGPQADQTGASKWGPFVYDLELHLPIFGPYIGPYFGRGRGSPSLLKVMP